MPLILTMNEGEEVFLGKAPLLLAEVGQGVARVVYEGRGSEISSDRMAEPAPSVFVCLGSPQRAGGAPLVIDAPRTLPIGRAPREGYPSDDPGFRACELTELAARRGTTLGLTRTRVREMARYGAPLSHARWNRRHGDYVLRVEKGLVLDVDLVPLVRPAPPAAWAPWAERCAICRGSLSILVSRPHAGCAGRGCVRCDAGLVWTRRPCRAATSRTSMTCSDFITTKEGERR